MARNKRSRGSGSKAAGAQPAGRAPLDPRKHEPHALQHPRTLVQWARRLLLGKPLHTEMALAHRLPLLMALPLFASDALSSIAYATQEILRVLLSAGAEEAAPAPTCSRSRWASSA
jgi:hypothetical protein